MTKVKLKGTREEGRSISLCLLDVAVSGNEERPAYVISTGQGHGHHQATLDCSHTLSQLLRSTKIVRYPT